MAHTLKFVMSGMCHTGTPEGLQIPAREPIVSSSAIRQGWSEAKSTKSVGFAILAASLALVEILVAALRGEVAFRRVAACPTQQGGQHAEHHDPGQ